MRYLLMIYEDPAIAPRTPALALARHAASWSFRRPTWTTRARILAVGSGLGLALASLRIRGLFALAAAPLGLFLIASGAAATSPRLREPREPAARF